VSNGTPVAGPFYFSLGGEGDSLALRCDWYIFRFAYVHEEGKNASLTLTIKNPGIGLLSTSLWCCFGCDFGVPGGATFLFKGRVTGLPTDLAAETIDVQFTARASDQAAQKQTLAETLKVRPYWDPLFIDKDHQDDPDTILQGYSRLWHIDPRTLAVATSDVLVGAGTTATFGHSAAFYDSVQITIEGSPISTINGTLTIPWTQTGSGTVAIGPYTAPGPNVANDWPKSGGSIPGGYTVLASTATGGGDASNHPTVNFSFSYQNTAKVHRDGDTMSLNENASYPEGSGPEGGEQLTLITSLIPGDPATGTAAEGSRQRTGFVGFIGESAQSTVSAVLGYELKAKHTETAKFALTSTLQPIVVDPFDTTFSEDLSISGQDAENDPVAAFDPTSWTYFATDRGNWSIEYGLVRAAARLMIGGRVGRVSWQTLMVNVGLLNCDMNAELLDDRLPNGAAVGKIIRVTMDGDGDTGQHVGGITIGCCVGTGAGVSGSAGIPTYASTDYVNTDYAVQLGLITLLPAGNVGYTPPAPPANGLQLPLTASQVVLSATVTSNAQNIADATAAAAAVGRNATSNVGLPAPLNTISPIDSGIADQQAKADAAKKAFQAAYAQVGSFLTLVVADLQGEQAGIEFDITTTPLSLPQQIVL